MSKTMSPRLMQRVNVSSVLPAEQIPAMRLLLAFTSVPEILPSLMQSSTLVLALADATMPARRVAVCRELTKLHEEVVRGSAGEVAAEFARREADGGVRGEIVLVIDAPAADEQAQRAQEASASAAERARQLLASGELSRKDVVKALREEFGISRNKAYGLVHGS